MRRALVIDGIGIALIAGSRAAPEHLRTPIALVGWALVAYALWRLMP